MPKVAVTVSGQTGSGKSRVLHEIEVALRAAGAVVTYCEADQEREARLEAWAEQSGAWMPDMPEIVFQEINTPIGIAEGVSVIEGAIKRAPQAPLDNRDWPIHRNKRGWPRWYQRWLEAWWILIGHRSLHRAWQAGHDNGSRLEYHRTVVVGGR